MEPILSASNISKSFIGVRALNNIDITINAGEIHCLAGENGCGKSTLVKCISTIFFVVCIVVAEVWQTCLPDYLTAHIVHYCQVTLNT